MGSPFTQCRLDGFLGNLFFGLLVFPLPVGESLGVENTEIQVSYSQQYACQHNDDQYHIDRPQFRNEPAVVYTYNRLIQNGLLFEQGRILFIHLAHYRGRFDPGVFHLTALSPAA
jgi:hypothetical protein